MTTNATSTTKGQTATTTVEERTTTENGMATNSTAGDRCVEMFFNIGASRDKSEADKNAMFAVAYAEDPTTALRILFYSRDVLQGQGERSTFRTIIQGLEKSNPEAVRKNIHLIPEFGRWDDLLVFIGTSLEDDAINLITKALTDGENGLCAKWMPRENSKTWPGVANKIRKALGVTPKEYRTILKTLSATANVVEQKMCANDWDNIDYSKVSSLAIKNYRKALYTHSEQRFSNYVESLKKGEAKISAKAVFPHDILKPIVNAYAWSNDRYYGRGKHEMEQTELDLLDQQWKALPNFMEGSSERIIPMCDVSGSMNGLPIEVCIALGLYISERNEGVFKNTFMTFSTKPTIEQVVGDTLAEKVTNLSDADWDGSTNMLAGFETLLSKAIQHNVPQEEMPNTILILSDMEFNHCVNSPEDTALEAIQKRYQEAGYEIPNIVFWNLKSRSNDNFPVKFNQKGAALVSGFSPSILTSILNGGNMTPKGIMFNTIGKERYSDIAV